MPLLNYTTKVAAERTAGEIMSLLSKKGATQVMMEFGPANQPVGLKWRVETSHGPWDSPSRSTPRRRSRC